MSKTYDAIIAGGGPVGLLLAGELALQRVSVLVLERETETKSGWKTLPLGRRGLNTLSFEALYRRGMLGKFVDLKAGGATSTMATGRMGRFWGHFAGITIPSEKVELERWKYRLDGPALYPAPTSLELMEKTLAERAEELGATIIRGSGFSQITAEDKEGVTVETTDGQSFRGKWLVGCDGGKSVVRKAAGFDFVGSDAQFTGYIAHCDLDHPEKLKPGFHPTKQGLYIIAPETLYLVDYDGAKFDRSQEVTQEHLQDVFERVSGVEGVNISKIHTVGTFTDRAMQATTYRRGRVVLAGDAAHIHSPLGAQGLNLGLGDAMNLGWKLAATIRAEKETVKPAEEDLTLLDTYETERYPIGERILEWTRVQVVTLQPDPFGNAVQSLIRDLMATTDGANLFMDRVMGLSNRYTLGTDAAHSHPLVGCSAPDFDFDDGSRLGPKLIGGKGLLIDFKGDLGLEQHVNGAKHEELIDYIVGLGAKEQCDVRALLVRPDGFVAWVTEEGKEPDVQALQAAMQRWFAH